MGNFSCYTPAAGVLPHYKPHYELQKSGAYKGPWRLYWCCFNVIRIVIPENYLKKVGLILVGLIMRQECITLF